MTDIPEFIVESTNISDETWKFFNSIQAFKKIKTLAGIHKKFTSLATNATKFRWKFGDEPGNPTIETTVNPYIHTYQHTGTYNVSHQSCYPCLITNSLICSNGWCTKSIEVEKEIEKEHESDSLIALAGFAGVLFIAKEDNCCKLRERCVEERATCASIKPTDKNKKACRNIENKCTTRLINCKDKCIKSGHKWEPSASKCIEKTEQQKGLCQTTELEKINKKRRKIEIY